MRIIYLVIRIMKRMTCSSNNMKVLIQLLKVDKNEFTKHHKDMALKKWLALLSLLAVEIHCLTRMLQTRNTVIKWLVAMSEEMESLQNKIWESRKLSKKKKAIGCKWVYHKKETLSKEKGDISLSTIHTNENASNMLTKPVPTDKFKHCLDLIGVRSL
jgi:hypothetical protein